MGGIGSYLKTSVLRPDVNIMNNGKKKKVVITVTNVKQETSIQPSRIAVYLLVLMQCTMSVG